MQWLLLDAGQDEKAFDLKQFFFGEHPPMFALEVMLRCCVMFLIVLFGMKVLGKRGVKELSVFELVIILSLGSAAGDPMFYREVGIVTCAIVFIVILTLYRLVIRLLNRSKRFEIFIKGAPVCLVRDGRLDLTHFSKELLIHDELFSELRQQSISQLGQIRLAILETSGELSIFYYEDEAVKPGLPLFPDALGVPAMMIEKAGSYSCTHCGTTLDLPAGEQHDCPTCGRVQWIASSSEKRVG